MRPNNPIAIHGHRGARGLFPENTIKGFTEAVKLGVDFIEMDVVVSADMKLIVSHEPWMNEEICLGPDGNRMKGNTRQKYNLYKMPFQQIAAFDCGSMGNAAFPAQKKIVAHKPRLTEVIEHIEKFVMENGLRPVGYNIEVKSEPGWDGIFQPAPEKFTQLLYNELSAYNIFDRILLQSFDFRILRELRKNYQNLTLGFLTETFGDVNANLNALGFDPDYYNPDFIFVNEELIRNLHKRNIKVVPWTVNDHNDMKRMVEMGVDGLITDYPDRALGFLKTL